MPHFTPPPELQHALEVITNTSPELLYACRDLDAWKSAKAVVNSIDSISSFDTEESGVDVDSERLTEGLERASSPLPFLTQSGSSPIRHPVSYNSSLVPSSSTFATTNLPPSVESLSSTKNSKRIPKISCEKFVNKVRDALKNLEQFSKNPSLDPILRKERQAMDLRIDFLRIIDGNKSPRELEIVLMGLSQLSYASCYSAWETKEKIPARLEEICSKLSRVSRKAGHIGRYARARYPQYKDVVGRGVREGIHKMALVKLLEKKVGKAIVDGMLAVLIFVYTKFRLLTFDQYPNIVDTIISEDSTIRCIKALSPWFADLRSSFELLLQSGPSTQTPDDASDVRRRGFDCNNIMPAAPQLVPPDLQAEAPNPLCRNETASLSNPISAQTRGVPNQMATERPPASKTRKRRSPPDNSSEHQILQRRRLSEEGEGNELAGHGPVHPEGNSGRNNRPDEYLEGTQDDNNYRNISGSDETLPSIFDSSWAEMFGTVDYEWLNEYTCD
ncbi:hypothetical protein TEQG_07168 [Trichophyton equinum CBS 127.97]|uniref:Uncharacterized protein n=1 Tax=Trichophyton equinum (strain ATCC MYA-4606 / CBS 127.97) TaxID=559882 RepID=F2Q273_TRIEC|nr:hypothetical protein TEQG_07168 [Trichophyton equinum CBS 127.97]